MGGGGGGVKYISVLERWVGPWGLTSILDFRGGGGIGNLWQME